MVRCPNCKKEHQKYEKKWKYANFDVETYSCDCGTSFREYTIDKKHSFTLRRAKNENRWKRV